jgi:hypothetical protein
MKKSLYLKKKNGLGNDHALMAKKIKKKKRERKGIKISYP